MADPFSPQGIPSPTLVALVEDHRSSLQSVATQWPDAGCLLADIGEYIVRCTMLMAELAAELANGRHIRAYAKRTIDEMKQETDFSELDHIDYLDTKHSSLKDIALEFQTAATIINARWLNSPKPPEMSIRHQKRPANRASVPLPRAVSHAASSPGAEYALHPTMPCQPGTRDIAPLMPQSDTTETDTSPMSDDAIHESVQDILDTLKSRGKDNHVCPWGNRCTKGGVGPDGNVVVFERNSAFRAHLEKHERLYRCDLPRCKNRKGFARRDQLERHQKTVPHDLE